jgi:hypothetical protein
VDAVEIFLLVCQVEARQMPCGVVGQSSGVDHQSDEIRLEMRVSDIGVIEVSEEGILISCPGCVGDLQLGLPLC